MEIVNRSRSASIALGVSPRFQVACCQDKTHGFVHEETPVTCKRRISEINTYLEQSVSFNNGLLRMGSVTMFDLAPPMTQLSRAVCRHSFDSLSI